MGKVKKGYNLKIEGIVISTIFLYCSLVCASPFYCIKNSLRVHLENGERSEQTLKILKIVKTVKNHKTLLLCYDQSMLLIKVLRELGEDALLIGLYEEGKKVPYHFYVRTRTWGNIDIFQEGHDEEELNGREVPQRQYEGKLEKFNELACLVLQEISQDTELESSTLLYLKTPIFRRIFSDNPEIIWTGI